MLKLNPLTQKKLNRFKSIKRGYYSFIILISFILLSFVAELFINSRALIVKYDGSYHFPTYRAIYKGSDFGENYSYEVKYRELKEKFAKEDKGNWVLMPFIPFNAFEDDLAPEGEYHPLAPSSERGHYLGTDKNGRDIAARLVYGFRIAILFSLMLLFANYSVGVTIGCMMGYIGGWFDLIFQRIIEIWQNIPFLYAIMIVSTLPGIVPGFWMLVGIYCFFGWMGITWYMRTATLKEREREYVHAAKAMGASNTRIIFSHVLPNTVSVLVTFIPFGISGAIIGLTSLDFLGYGLPAPTPSWGELLQQGTEQLHAPWIVTSVFVALVVILFMVSLIGEAVREAFDPKKFTTYE